MGIEIYTDGQNGVDESGLATGEDCPSPKDEHNRAIYNIVSSTEGARENDKELRALDDGARVSANWLALRYLDVKKRVYCNAKNEISVPLKSLNDDENKVLSDYVAMTVDPSTKSAMDYVKELQVASNVKEETNND